MTPTTPAEIAWVMRTLDRHTCTPPRRNYLRQTIDRMVESHGGQLPPQFHLVDSRPALTGGGETWYYHELSALPSLPQGMILTYTYHPTLLPLTNNQNALRALRIGVATGLPWIVHLEDDLDVCDDVFGSIARWLTRHADPAYALFTFHAPYRAVRHRVATGHATWEYPIRGFYGNQCWAMRREEAASAADFLERIIPTWSSGQGFDLILKAWAVQREGQRDVFLASCPSFVQHVGEESSLHLGRFHRNGSWPGRAWRYE